MRKLIFVIFVCVLFSSCSTNRIVYTSLSGMIDYSKYTQKGFFITESNSVSFEYVPVGSVYAEISSGYEVIGEKIDTFYNDLEKSYYSVKKKTFREDYNGWRNADINNAIDMIYSKSIQTGANGIINLQTKYIPPVYDSKNALIYSDRVYVSGMAIKIKQKN